MTDQNSLQSKLSLVKSENSPPDASQKPPLKMAVDENGLPEQVQLARLHCKFYVLFGLHILHDVYQNLIYTDKLYALHMTLYAYSLNGGSVRAAARVTGQLAYAN